MGVSTSVPGVVSGAPVTGQAAELAEHFRAVNDEVIAFVQGCSAEQWRGRTHDEDWPLAAGGMHIALGHLSSRRGCTGSPRDCR